MRVEENGSNGQSPIPFDPLELFQARIPHRLALPKRFEQSLALHTLFRTVFSGEVKGFLFHFRSASELTGCGIGNRQDVEQVRVAITAPVADRSGQTPRLSLRERPRPEWAASRSAVWAHCRRPQQTSKSRRATRENLGWQLAIGSGRQFWWEKRRSSRWRPHLSGAQIFHERHFSDFSGRAIAIMTCADI